MDITILDGTDVPHPEDVAMLQALYSRSPAKVQDHLEKVRKAGSGEFMDRYYVGYNHKSIGDCGTTSIFVEGVTMLTAKAIQDWPLYSGQEASTRYMDFSQAEFSNPLKSWEGEAIQQRWRSFYLEAQALTEAHLRERYPQHGGEDPKTYNRAIKARTFDTLRCFLPAGAQTNLSWHTNLRQASDHLEGLLVHPDHNVRDVAQGLWESLATRYPNSFKMNERPGVQEYAATAAADHFLQGGEDFPEFCFRGPRFDQQLLEDSGDLRLLRNRPRTAPVPRRFSEWHGFESLFRLDFGSYRDLQRHRNGLIRMPLLTTELGFNGWYLDELPSLVRDEALILIEEQRASINALECDKFTRQNYIAMGFQVPCHVLQNLPALIYRLELRSSKTVHPSLRRVVLKEIAEFKKRFPDIALHVDEEPDSWSIRRGNQTIAEKA